MLLDFIMIISNSSLEFSHFPVMLDEVIKTSSIKRYSIIDCTLEVEVTQKFLEFSDTKVIAFDRDFFVADLSKVYKNPNRFIFLSKKFSELDSVITDKLVDIVVFDLDYHASTK